MVPEDSLVLVASPLRDGCLGVEARRSGPEAFEIDLFRFARTVPRIAGCV